MSTCRMAEHGAVGADCAAAAPGRNPSVDALKAVACLAIVVHHLALYGPMADVIQPHAPQFFRWAIDYGRMSVQVFLVVAGYLALPALAANGAVRFTSPGALILKRYRRLAPPYLAALLVSVLIAMALRPWFIHDSMPAAPTWSQALAHVLLLQDALGHEALSAGVWYVAIDLQLFALAALVFSISGRRAALAATLIALLAAASLFVFNRIAWFDFTALYFFGSYALGLAAASVAHAFQQGRAGRAWLLFAAMALLAAAALTFDFRGRIALAAAVAVLLVLLAVRPVGARGQAALRQSWLVWLGRISYSVFLVHFQVCLAVNAVVSRFWPTDVATNAAGLLVAVGLSVAAGGCLYRWVESPDARWRRAAATVRTARMPQIRIF